VIAQIVYFNGPRSPELVAATDRARRERIIPAVSADPEIRAGHRGTFVLRQPDGSQLILILADSPAILDRGDAVASATHLLPAEDPALLGAPDRIERYEVVAAYDAGFLDLVPA
jgi:hypothetical protein